MRRERHPATEPAQRSIRLAVAPVLRRFTLVGALAALIVVGLTVSAQNGTPDTPN